MKLERSALLHFVDASMRKDTGPTWFQLGEDLEDFSIELNPDIETKKNIKGENSIKDNGYEPNANVDPYYANPSDAIYEPIRDIAFERKKGDACMTKYLEVIIDDTEAESHLAFVEEVMIKPTSYGGGTEGVAIPFDIKFTGKRTKGTVTLTAGVPTFVAAK